MGQHAHFGFGFLFGAVAACNACQPAPAPVVPSTSVPLSREALAVDLAAKTTALVHADGEDQGAYCSGVWVSDNEFLTAGHCVEDASVGDSVQYVVQGDVLRMLGVEVILARSAHIADLNRAHDLALIRSDSAPAHEVAEIATEVLFPGSPVFTMGQPLGLWWSYSSGEIAAIRWYADDDTAMWYIQATAPISPGNSGGGLFDAQGHLIGITRANFPAGENLNLFIHRDYVAAFLGLQL